MQTLSHRQQKYLIESLARGEMTDDQALQYAARNKILSHDGYARSLVLTVIGAAAAYVVVGAATGMLAGGVVLAIGLEAYFKQRKATQQQLKLVDQGEYRDHFLDEPESLKLIDEWAQTIETPATPVAVESTPATDVDLFSAPNPDPQTAFKFLLSLTTNPLQPVIIAGLPGSGKGILAAMALSLGAKHNGLRFWLFNAKPKLEEAGYWLWAERHYLKNRLQADENLFADLMAVLEDFGAEGTRRNDQPGEYPPFVLLLEEVNALTGLLTPKQRQIFKAKITALASLLRGCKMAIWLSGQSITLEDLGLTGKSNRAMFTAIAAVGAEREAVGAICQPLGISVDLSRLEAGQRYWLTASSSFAALPAPAVIPQFSDWAAVPNMVDLRPGAAIDPLPTPTVESVFEAEAESSDPPASSASLPRRRPKIYRPTQSGKKEVPDEIAQLIEQYSEDPKLVDFLRLLATKQPGNTFDLRSLQGTQWAKRNGRAKEDIEPVLIEAISLGLLTEISSGEYRVEAL